MQGKDLYEVLGINRDATDKEVKAAYRRLARKYHPDVNPGDPEAERRFKELQAAYSVLGDPQKRKQYDRHGNEFFSPGGPAQGPGVEWEEFVRGFGQRGARVNFGGIDFDVFSDVFGGEFDSGPRAEPRPVRGRDVYQPVTVDFLEAARGATITLTLRREVHCDRCGGNGAEPGSSFSPCPACGGSGDVTRGAFVFSQKVSCPQCNGSGRVASKTCMRCRGSGRMPKKEKIEVKIPAGVDTGSKVRVPGKGLPGTNGGPYGDLLLNVTVRPHPYFQREGSNVHLDVPVTIAEALLGAEIEIPTLDKRVRMRIPPGTDSGQEFRLRGKGFPHLTGAGSGDLLARIKIVTPKKVGVKGRELIREFAKEHPQNPRLKLFGF